MEEEIDEDDGRKASVLPKWIKFMPSNDEFYPAEFDSVIYDCYNLRVVFDRDGERAAVDLAPGGTGAPPAPSKLRERKKAWPLGRSRLHR